MLNRLSRMATTLLVLVGLTAGCVKQWPTTVSTHDTRVILAATTAPTFTPAYMYLPAIIHNFSKPDTFGLVVDVGLLKAETNQAFNLGGSWIRGTTIKWSAIEPVQGEFHWEKLNRVLPFLIQASQNGWVSLATVTDTPAWAQKWPGVACGPMDTQYLSAFGDFFYELVSRLKQPPTNLKIWEIWNEPDVAGFVDWGIGCWGDQNDPYNGGGYYAQMLKAVYPRIKAADPDARVYVGGLMLSCDPNHPPSGWSNGCLESKFLEGILAGGGGESFDGVSIHSYDYYYGGFKFANTNWASSSAETGPSVIAKTRYIRSLLEKYSTSPKEIMNTETALLCRDCVDNAQFEETKAHFMTQSYVVSLALGLKASLWFSMGGWLNSGLVDSKGDPLPAYLAYQFAREKLSDALYLGEVTAADTGGSSPVRGYKFRKAGQERWVLWSTDGKHHPVMLPNVPGTIYRMNAAGAFDVEAQSAQVTVTAAPIYLLW